LVRLHRGDKGRLARGATATFSASTLTAPIGVIQLDPSYQWLPVVALLHHLEQLVLHAPSGIVADAQLPLELQRRDSVLRLRQEKHPEEPGCQRQLGVLENRPADQRGLMILKSAVDPARPEIPA
jgi:hypothetical protein